MVLHVRLELVRTRFYTRMNKMAFAEFNIYKGLYVHVRLTMASPTIEQFKTFLDGMLQILDRNEKMCMLVDSTAVKSAPLSAAWAVIEFMKANRTQFQKLSNGTAIVVGNETVANLLNFAFKVQPPTSPYLVSVDIDTANAFVREKLLEISPVYVEA